MSLNDAPNINHLWAGLLVEELVRCGAGFFCISPGSRSTPLACAVAQTDVPQAVHFDERGAAFYALGWARATGRPAVCICTSGSAVANYWPAVVEADASGVPLILLTADRPPELLKTGANQAIDQTEIFGKYVRWFFNLPCPTTEISPRLVLSTVDQAVHHATGAHAGPVHLNCMFREPLAPEGPPGAWTEYLAPLSRWDGRNPAHTQWNRPQATLSDGESQSLFEGLRGVRRGILVLGELRNVDEVGTAGMLAMALRWPVLPDITSGLRMDVSQLATATRMFGLDTAPPWITHHDQILLSKRGRKLLDADFILHIGGRITSKRLQAHLSELDASYFHVSEGPLPRDPDRRVTHRIQTGLRFFCTELTQAAAQWANPRKPRALIKAQETVGNAMDAWLEEQHDLNEIGIARSVSRLRPDGSTLFLGNSMPVRDMDMYAAADGPFGPVIANRGASGIDGNIATAAGFALAHGRPMTALIGDLATLHDLNSLTLLRGLESPFVLVVINNDGGGIFSFLPIAETAPEFETYFGTPHGLGFEDAARMFGLAYENPATPTAFEDIYAHAIAQPGATLIELRTDRVENVRLHKALQAHIVAALETNLGKAGK